MNRELAEGRSGLLSAASQKIRTLLVNITKNAFEIGQTLNRVKATEAYSAGFDAFEAWVETTGLGTSTAYRLMKVASTFTKDEYIALVGLGKTKLFLLASAPTEDRAELTRLAKSHDVAKLEKAVLRARASRGEVVKPRKANTPTTKEEKAIEFTKWAASLPCMKGEKCGLNASTNSGEYCVVHAARDVLAGSRIGKKLLRRIS